MTSQPQVEPSHYRGLDYNTKGRWASYWHQISEVLDVSPASCLEVGVGAGYVRHALQENGVTVTTVDIDPRLGVDRVGDVSALSCADGEFDVVLCAQVLEHVP
jgi:2-polyprenyl-3-methyl-5-hydroxy-6-metoxy-1,4-benzoquinol methylase